MAGPWQLAVAHVLARDDGISPDNLKPKYGVKRSLGTAKLSEAIQRPLWCLCTIIEAGRQRCPSPNHSIETRSGPLRDDPQGLALVRHHEP